MENAAAARYAVGLGCDRGTPLQTVRQALEQALQRLGASPAQVAALASIEAKGDELAFVQLAQQLALPLQLYSAAQLAAVPVPNPSATVLRFMGTPSVSEAAALLAAGQGRGAQPMAALQVEKHKHQGLCGKNATVSVALMGGSTHD
ncbi:cobalamin biosynthesis protein [Roseateles sp. BYS180W]|uniref:Cobalamin biosynthesis protein n=1 Tax=Roseateles rivi TaxID=3299028 RepID=A0ABW7FSS7_9BURK